MEPNNTQYRQGQKEGHYESYFQRANHPSKPLAFWIRYTLFSPRGNPQKALGELWAVFFDGKSHDHICAKAEYPLDNCHFDRNIFEVNIGEAHLNEGKLEGMASAKNNSLKWNLAYSGNEKPLYLLPIPFYHLPFPKAKALVGFPLATYNGELKINGKEVAIDNWVGSQNHNWGSEHTDRYAWGQIAGFDNYPNSFFEIATAQVKFGLFHSPRLTVMVLRHKGQEYLFNGLNRSLKNKGKYSYFEWKFSASNGKEKINGRIWTEAKDVVGLNYYNPPGGDKTCLNTKIAHAEITFIEQDGSNDKLFTSNRAAFEILTNDTRHGIPVLEI